MTKTYSAGVDSQAVILVSYVRAADGDSGRVANVECVSVGSQIIGIAVSVVNGDARQGQIGRAVNAEDLHRRVLDVDPSDGRGFHAMSIEEFGLCLASIASLAVPPARPIAVEVGT